MSDRTTPVAGVLLGLAGIAIALWTLLHPWGTFVGADVGRSGQWIASHSFHFLGGMLGSLGLLGLVGRLSSADTLERTGFTVAFVGTVLFAGTGLFTAFLWPFLAIHAPALTEIDGPFFSPPHPLVGITAMIFSAGYIILAVALARARVISMGVASVLSIGAVLLALPPAPFGPLPWIAFPAGGVLFGAGLLFVASSMRSTARPRSARAPA